MKKICSVLLVLSLCMAMPGAFSEELPMTEPPAAAETAQPPAESPLAESFPVTEAPVDTPAAQETTPAPENPAPSPEAEPEITPVPEATPEADVTQLPAETPAPETEPSVDPSPVPETTPEMPDASLEPEVTPEASVAPTPEPALIEGWILDESGAKLVPGTLEELLAVEGELKICISSGEQLFIERFPTRRLQEISFLPDGDVFPGTDWRVVCSRSERLRDEYSAGEIANAQEGDEAPLYIWVREELPAPTEDPTELQMIVRGENVVTGQWSNVQPVFSMEGSGADAENCDFAVIILDERIAMLSGSSYVPEEEGVYTVRLAMMNRMGDIVDRSEKYTLWLDWSAPELAVEVSMEKHRSMTVYAGDRVSGVAGISLDGGESWTEGQEVLSYTASENQSFAPGMIQVRDHAGNVSWNETEIELKKLPSYGGGGGSSVSKQHSSGDGETAEYAAYALELPDGESTVLSLGGEELALMLTGADEMQALPFHAELASWASSASRQDAAASPDTLVLRATEPEEEGKLIWHVNGAVLRKLYNSGIAYLLLERDGEMLSLPTIGFTAGTRYAELKMMGTSTQEFDYEIHMDMLAELREECAPGFNQARRLQPGLWVEVEGERFEMLDRAATPEMYFYDVYCASEDLPAYPYGTYPGTTELHTDDETEV